MQKVTIKALFQQSLTELEEQYRLKADFPSEEGETWSFAAIYRIKGGLDVLVDLISCPLNAEEISEVYHWQAELFELDPAYQREAEAYKSRKKILEDFVSKLDDR
ncbi:hypothetical protein NIES2135_54140 [Leptolyngbya boryana NIES-2135]|jgi:hypothetical protein|uniref:Uncharacterized protein n=1 Tax=Leptolyngbya boryana NIES-2135 TaxID=1973484 RepID=A0A1Z4JP47_LEPBY|nr:MULTISPECIES: hypothetical protein [Leptolyngbya]BAY58541.1 hypothetical protein NIES2135_54140 [Leptolyngbya boryana NIES-2135]MBD2370780.1 hypothetical protein [Leptolyngbya sp. FACHB-161]MBD2377067.1 hypothetical protein [Leptolyngbya sp. FACHB-238]MBD2401510.1 hypothetical protein [Leptolyngbya sp. FACHB-239]MBD2408062.1 hypothetical protein [Leptolyngbya sp. FACHB-402]